MDVIELENINELIKKLVKENNEEVINLRQSFHKIPERGFEEYKTSKEIFEYLKSLGLKVKRIAKTGVIADINDDILDYCIALRFDIDALPIEEETGVDYSSTYKGMMHACGHDGHISIGLGLAKLLMSIKNLIPARIRFIFQPAEEGLGGAKQMIKEGVLENPKPNLIIGLHIWPYIKSGNIGIKSGPVMAAGDKFYIKLIGKEGHGSGPHLTVDPTIMASEVIQGFQKIISRNINPVEPSVISIGTINGGNSFNTIPNCVELTGTTRFTNMNLREVIKNRMEDIIKSVVHENGGMYEFIYYNCFDVTDSDEKLVNIIRKTATELIGNEKVILLDNPSMASEDFSEYERFVPGLYFFLGTNNKEKNCIYPLHHSKFNLDEEILSIGVNLMGKFVYDLSKSRVGEVTNNEPI